MKYEVKHIADLNERELTQAETTLPLTIGEYFVVDYEGNVYGRYEEYEDAIDHATLLEMEQL
jgi:hypothetical protein